MINPILVAAIIVILISIFWRFVLGIPFAFCYRCPECGKFLTKRFTCRVKRCPYCNKEIDWEKLINETDF